MDQAIIDIEADAQTMSMTKMGEVLAHIEQNMPSTSTESFGSKPPASDAKFSFAAKHRHRMQARAKKIGIKLNSVNANKVNDDNLISEAVEESVKKLRMRMQWRDLNLEKRKEKREKLKKKRERKLKREQNKRQRRADREKEEEHKTLAHSYGCKCKALLAIEKGFELLDAANKQ